MILIGTVAKVYVNEKNTKIIEKQKNLYMLILIYVKWLHLCKKIKAFKRMN